MALSFLAIRVGAFHETPPDETPPDETPLDETPPPCKLHHLNLCFRSEHDDGDQDKRRADELRNIQNLVK